MNTITSTANIIKPIITIEVVVSHQRIEGPEKLPRRHRRSSERLMYVQFMSCV